LNSPAVFGLRNYKIDRLPPNIRARAVAIGRKAEQVQAELEEDIDSILRSHAASPMADSDPEQETRAKLRAQHSAQLRQIYPGRWRGRGKA
jgi:hypothetical protein